jgi:hypothetical protein
VTLFFPTLFFFLRLETSLKKSDPFTERITRDHGTAT